MLKVIHDLLGQMNVRCRLDNAIVQELQAQHDRIYALEENRKMKDAAILQLQKDVQALKLQLREKVKVDVV